jgi:starch synthase
MNSSSPNQPLRVMFLAAEAEPFIKVGGLGDVGGALPLAIHKLNKVDSKTSLDIRIVLPLHPMISVEQFGITWLRSFEVPTPHGTVTAQVHTTSRQGMPIYFIASPHFNNETAVYSMDTSHDADKYLFFSLAALELARALDWRPDILHANDWHTAAAIYKLALLRSTDSFYANTASLLTLHNLPFMGAGSEKAMTYYGLHPVTDPRLPVWGRQFPLTTGLLFADAIVAVSPTYAREVLTPEFGCGLQDFLATRKEVIHGILNGQDTDAWNPSHDPYINQTFSVDQLEKRVDNKRALLSEFDLPYHPQKPLVILVSRMDPQKGVDIALEALKRIIRKSWQAILLGSGDPVLEKASAQLAATYPDRIRTVLKFDSKLSHRMYAGADILMMPSRYEPCGLSQMNAMRYGCIPVVRATGGLKDTVTELAPPQTGTGFSCVKADSSEFSAALTRALDSFKNQAYWKQMQVNAMQQDFSWDVSAATYVKLYQSLGRLP